MSQGDQERQEETLDEAIKAMDEALENANGRCTERVRRRTTKTRRALREIAGELTEDKGAKGDPNR